MSAAELLALVCCDLGAIVRGRSLPASELGERLAAGVGWVPANHALTPLGPLAEPNPFGACGDLRLLPDPATHVRVGAGADDGPGGALELILCDIVETDGQPWECCPRRFLRDALRELAEEAGVSVLVAFEHEFQLLGDSPAALPFSLDAMRALPSFAAELMGALAEAGVEPELFFSEFAPHQFEIPVAPAEGLAGADRSIVLKEVVRELARRHSQRASFAPLLDPAGPGNGLHIHLSLLDRDGAPALYDDARPGCLSELGGSFAAGILAHARALTALTAPSPCSAARLVPHRWSAGAICLAQGNREALLRIPPLLSLAGADPAGQLRLEYRGADACANPHLALGGVVRAGLDGVRTGLKTPPILHGEIPLPGEGLPASLQDSLIALEQDEVARGWMPGLLHDAYLSVKRAELAAVAGLEELEVCRRYGAVY
jgi:glutamine synthetase